MKDVAIVILIIFLAFYIYKDWVVTKMMKSAHEKGVSIGRIRIFDINGLLENKGEK
jgi:hypothetical protein